MPPLMRVLLVALAILAVIELVPGRSLVPWLRRQERPLQTRGRALYLVLFVASMLASWELRASTVGYVLLGLALVVLLGATIGGSRQGRLSQGAGRTQLGRLS